MQYAGLLRYLQTCKLFLLFSLTTLPCRQVTMSPCWWNLFTPFGRCLGPHTSTCHVPALTRPGSGYIHKQCGAAEADLCSETVGAEDATTSTFTFQSVLLWSRSSLVQVTACGLSMLAVSWHCIFLFSFRQKKNPIWVLVLSCPFVVQDNQNAGVDASPEAFPALLPETGVKTKTMSCSSMPTLRYLGYFLTRGKHNLTVYSSVRRDLSMLYWSCVCYWKPCSCHKALIPIKVGVAAYWKRVLMHAVQTGLFLVQMMFVMRAVVQRITVRKKCIRR